MKSCIQKEYPFIDADISAHRKALTIDAAMWEEALLRLQRKHTHWIQGERVLPGDVAECRLQGKSKRYQRDHLQLKVGAFLFDEELEQFLLGKTIGSYETMLAKEVVRVEICSIRHPQLPPLSDALIASCHIPEVKTLADYQQQIFEQKREELLAVQGGEVMEEIIDQVLNASAITIVPQDEMQYVAWELGRIRVLCALEGMTLETMQAKDFEGRIPVSSYQELTELLRQEAPRSLSIALLGGAHGGKGSEEGYDAFIEELAKQWQCDRKQMQSAYPYEYYAVIEQQNAYYDLLREYVKQQIRMEVR